MNKVANALYAGRKILLILWIILIVGFGFYAAKLPSVLGGNGFEMKGMYKDTEQLLVNKFDVSEAQIIVLFEKKDGVSDSKFQQTIAQYMQKAKDKSDASKVDIPTASNKMIKGSTAYRIIHFNHDDGTMDKRVEKIRTLSADEKEVSVKLTGGPIIEKDMNTASQADLAKAEAIGIPVALVVLLLAFGSVVAAAIPLMIGIVTVVTTMGVVYFFHPYTELSIFILNVIPMIGLALSIDFALLFINRFKEEIQTKSIEQAIKITIQTAGRSVIFSGLCVFIGLAGMLFIQVDIFQNVALGGMAVVFIAVFSALTLLPSILAILGTRINRLRILKVSEQGGQSRWRSFATFVMKMS
ncbi:MMPL family transporter [Priestia megaterium]|uniref:MMPL family transporter n=1 Tax=Priestia megaterium TaxID=1404 RepID=UPI003A4C552F